MAGDGLRPCDIRVDTFRLGSSWQPVSLKLVHLPTGLSAGPQLIHPSARRTHMRLLRELTDKVQQAQQNA